MQDTLTFTFSKGYHNLGNVIDVPDGALIEPSRNVLFDMNGRLSSFRGFSGLYSAENQFGGNKSFVLDRDTVAFVGTPEIYGVGNVTQAVGRSLWFVGNSGSALRVYDLSTGNFKSLGGTYHLEQLFIDDEDAVELTVLSDVTATAGSITSGGSYFTKVGHEITNNTPVRIRLKSELPEPLQEKVAYPVLRDYVRLGTTGNKATETTTTFRLLDYYSEVETVAPVGLIAGPPPNSTLITVAFGQIEDDVVSPFSIGDLIFINSNEVEKDLFLKYNTTEELKPYTPYYVINVVEEESDPDDEDRVFISFKIEISTDPLEDAIEFVPLVGYDPLQTDSVTKSIKIFGGRVIDLITDGLDVSIAESTSDSDKVKFTGEDSTDLLTVQAGSTVPFVNGETVAVAPTGALPAPLERDVIYYAEVIDSDKFRVSVSADSPPIQFTNAGEGTFLVDVNPYLDLSFTSSEPEINKDFKVPVRDGFNQVDVANAIRDVLRTDAEIAANFSVNTYSDSTGDGVRVQDRQIRVNDLSLVLSGGNGIATSNSTEEQEGGPVTEYILESSTPLFAKYGSDGWLNPVTIGLRELEDIDKPRLDSVSNSARGREFAGLVTGSRTVKVARKRFGAVSIASPSSNLIMPPDSGSSLYVSIPVTDPDDSPREDNSWLLYFTFAGLGSTESHFLFPLEISEAELDGSAVPELKQTGNAKYKVVKQSTSVKGNRVVEVEFLDNDLLPLEVFDDYYPAEPCKFIVKLGNSMCLIGTGDDSTGFDVSFPNNYEAYTPEWRDWLAEQPVSVATESELGYFWACSANNTYVAAWTGVTEDSAPILLEKRSNKVGTIGEKATVCVGGMLYTLTRGKVPVRMSPQGEADIFFGARVQSYFTSVSGSTPLFDEDTVLSWDSVTNSIVFSCRGNAIAFQIDNQLWSAPITFNFEGLHSFDLNGQLYFTSEEEVEEEDKFVTWQWNSGTEYDWNMTSSFAFGRYGNMLKDITKFELMYSTPYVKPNAVDPEDQEEVDEVNALDVRALKNYRNSDAPKFLASIPLTRTGSTMSIRKYVESLDYNSVSMSISGKVGGTTLHMLNCELDVHTIERTSL
jgi:hypothetical protein